MSRTLIGKPSQAYETLQGGKYQASSTGELDSVEDHHVGDLVKNGCVDRAVVTQAVLAGIDALSGDATQVVSGAGTIVSPGVHLPSGGSVGQVVTNTAPGTGTWQTRGPYPYVGEKGSRVPWSRPTLATFSTWLNQDDGGGKLASVADGANRLPLVITAPISNAGALYCPTGLLKSPPTPPWTITVAFAAQWADGNNNPQGFWPIVLQSAAGKLVYMLWTPTAVALESSNDSNVGTAANFTLDDYSNGFRFSDYVAWFQMVHSGSEVSGYFSPDGFDFDPLTAPGALAFLGDIAKVGFGLNRGANSNSSKSARVKLWDWRET